MLKVNVSHIASPSACSFPYLATDVETDLIVLLISPSCGICVQQGDTRFQVGYYTVNWLIHKLTPFVGSVTLENKRE